MSKAITLIVPGAEGSAEARDTTIESGTTAADVLRAAGLNPADWQIQLRRGADRISVGSQEELLDKVEDHEKVLAMATDMVVG